MKKKPIPTKPQDPIQTGNPFPATEPTQKITIPMDRNTSISVCLSLLKLLLTHPTEDGFGANISVDVPAPHIKENSNE